MLAEAPESQDRTVAPRTIIQLRMLVSQARELAEEQGFPRLITLTESVFNILEARAAAGSVEPWDLHGLREEVGKALTAIHQLTPDPEAADASKLATALNAVTPVLEDIRALVLANIPN